MDISGQIALPVPMSHSASALRLKTMFSVPVLMRERCVRTMGLIFDWTGELAGEK